MRVLHLARPAAGGMLRYLQEVLPRLQAEGVEGAVACPVEMHPALAPFPTLSWEVSDRPHPWRDLRCALQAWRWQGEYDLFHAHGLRAAAVLALAPPSRWVFTLHNLPPTHLSPLVRWLLSRAARSAGRILAVSRAVQEGWLRHFPFSAPRCAVIPGGVDVQAIHPSGMDPLAARRQWNLPEEAPVALCVARLMEDKGIDVLVRALACVPAWYVLVVGEGPQRHALLQLASSIGVGERVRFTGYLPLLDAAWAACDVAVVPSRREGLGLFALEAMAAEKPVIATRTGGLAEVVLPGETGWLVPPDDPAALAEGLQQALAQRARWSEMGRRGRAHVRQHYCWEHTAQRLVEIYRSLLSR